jgi:aflatoxin B1 aldehyde reductase
LVLVQVLRMVQSFLSAGHVETDTAFMYGQGETEKIMGRWSDELKKKLLISTKVNPWAAPWNSLNTLSVNQQFKTSLERLKLQQPIDILYLHMPDHKTSIEETLKAVNDLYSQGKFCRFGLSNYAAWQVVEIFYLCKSHGWVLPTVYQGMYNAFTREVERELFPALRRLNIAFYAYNPLAGGLLTGRYKFSDLGSQPTGRFFGNSWAEHYRARYWNQTLFEAIENVQKALTEVYGPNAVSMTEASLRWLMHHSQLNGERGDAVIVGASSVRHMDENLAACARGPLHERVVAAFDAGWRVVIAHGQCPSYFR